MHDDYTPTSESANKGNSAHQGFGPMRFRSLLWKMIPASTEFEWVDFYAHGSGISEYEARADFYADVRKGDFLIETDDHQTRRLITADKLYLRRFSDAPDSPLCLFASMRFGGLEIDGLVSKLEVKRG